MNTDTQKRRRDRADRAPLARPQGGVDALAGKFPGGKGAPAGVADDGDPEARPVPTFGIKGTEGTPKGQ